VIKGYSSHTAFSPKRLKTTNCKILLNISKDKKAKPFFFVNLRPQKATDKTTPKRSVNE
jgi:hypothetical protein